MNEAEHEFAAAIERFRSALVRVEEPFARDELALAQEQLGDLLRQTDRAAEAERYYEQARSTRQSLPVEAEYRYKLAKLLGKFTAAEQRQEGLAAAKLLADEFPLADKYLTLYGSLLFQAGDYDQCIAVLEKIDASAAASNSAHDFWLALAYAARANDGDAELAEQAQSRAEQRLRDHAPGCHELLMLQRRLAESLKPKPSKQ